MCSPPGGADDDDDDDDDDVDDDDDDAAVESESMVAQCRRACAYVSLAELDFQATDGEHD